MVSRIIERSENFLGRHPSLSALAISSIFISAVLFFNKSSIEFWYAGADLYKNTFQLSMALAMWGQSTIAIYFIVKKYVRTAIPILLAVASAIILIYCGVQSIVSIDVFKSHMEWTLAFILFAVVFDFIAWAAAEPGHEKFVCLDLIFKIDGVALVALGTLYFMSESIAKAYTSTYNMSGSSDPVTQFREIFLSGAAGLQLFTAFVVICFCLWAWERRAPVCCSVKEV